MIDDYPRIGGLLRERRKYHGWTLSDVGKMTGLSVSTISKIETGQMSPTYDKIIQIARGLQVEIADLFEARNKTDGYKHIMGRRSMAKAEEGVSISSGQDEYTYLCNELAHKQIVPVMITVGTRSLEDIGELHRFPGEQFLYVINGEIRVFTEYYEPADLVQGDSMYMDSTMGHGVISTSDDDAVILVNHASDTPNLAQSIRDIVRDRMLSE
jgi:DNA-binding XRE family transcriptional regulator